MDDLNFHQESGPAVHNPGRTFCGTLPFLTFVLTPTVFALANRLKMNEV
jgi:hypothetical protein